MASAAKQQTAEKPQEEKKQEVTTTGGAPPPAFLDEMRQDAGKGVSTAAEDRIIPLIYILQSNSPQCNKRDPAYINGAEAGDIWLRNAAVREVIPGDEGMLFQPCGFFKIWLEWLPNRGGFVAQHADDGSVDPASKRGIPPKHLGATEREVPVEGNPDKRKKVWVTPGGNNLVHTRQHVGIAYVDGVGRPYIIPMSSTGHTVSRKWMDQMNQFLVPGTSDVAPSFARKWKFTTVAQSNDFGTWSVYKITDAGWVSADEYKAGKALHEAFARGEKEAEAPQEQQVGETEVPF